MTIPLSHDHVGITLTPPDLEPTIRWYGAALGYRVERRFTVHGTDFVFLASGSSRIELMTYATASSGPIADMAASMNPARLHHICLRVDDLDAALAELDRAGVQPIGGPMRVDEIHERFAFVSDNLGNVLELTESV